MEHGHVAHVGEDLFVGPLKIKGLHEHVPHPKLYARRGAYDAPPPIVESQRIGQGFFAHLVLGAIDDAERVNDGQTRAHFTNEGEVGGLVQFAQQGFSVGEVDHHVVQAIVEHVGEEIGAEDLAANAPAVLARDHSHLANGAGEFGVVKTQVQAIRLAFVQVATQSQIVWAATNQMSELIMALDAIDCEVVAQ